MTVPTSTAIVGTLPPVPPAAPSPVEASSPASGCDVCPHPAEAHDVIGRRFCDATVLGALTRGCICRS